MSLVNSIYSSTRPLFEYLKKQKENQKFIRKVEIASTFTLITFFLIFAIRPTFLTISSLLGEIKAKETSTQLMKAKINNLIQAQDNFAQVQERYQIINTSLPDKNSFSTLYDQLQASARQSAFTLETLNFSLNQKDAIPSFDAAKKYQVSLTSPTPFTSFVNFVDIISQNRRLIDISNLTFSSKNTTSKTASQSSEMLSTFSADVYYWTP
jgi:Tfp pilus assembly protein PilO